MIVNLRGTSGSGKSTIVRKLMKRYALVVPERIEGRKQPLGYVCKTAPTGRDLFVLGHYETECGGGDTISLGMEFIYDLIRQHIAVGRDIIYEGLVVQSDVRRCIELAKSGVDDLIVVALSTPLDVCLASIQARRDARGDTRPLNPDHTIKKNKEVERQGPRFKDANVDFRKLNRDDAQKVVLEAFGWSV